MVGIAHEDELIDETLRTVRDLPGPPRVERTEWSRFTDEFGNDALMIFLIVGDRTPEEHRMPDVLWPLRRAILNRLSAEGIEAFPVTRILTRREYAQVTGRKLAHSDVEG